LKVIDLFAGVGGMSLGFESEGFEVVYANEYDKAIASAYELNHPGTEVDTRDIREIDFIETFSRFRGLVDVVVGGPPCQGFSQKGKRIGLDDERNFMFRKFFEVVEVVQPEFVVIENVPNLLTAVNGAFKDEIIEEFRSKGYAVEHKILKAENFGVPQIRRRAIFLARKGDSAPSLLESNGKRVTVAEAIGDLPQLLSGEGEETSRYTIGPLSPYQKQMRRGAKLLHNHVATKHSAVALERLKYIGVNGTKEDLPPEHRTKSIHSGTWSRIHEDSFARTITTRFDTPSSGQFTLANQDRCLTVREAARIQSFPDTFVFTGSKSSQMLQVGNAVPPLLAAAIAKVIRSSI
jgi:DNA (cytosine-5)-methyltransferase 1